MSSVRQSQDGLPKAPKLYENNYSNNLIFFILQKIENATQITFALLHQYKMEAIDLHIDSKSLANRHC